MEKAITQYTKIHFSGIKGVGMTALALYAQDMGIKVTGSDLSQDYVTAAVLAKRKIPLTIGFNKEALPLKTEALIYSAARANTPELTFAQSLGIPVYSYAQALSLFLEGKETIAVCGVGGKTTTTAMLATILTETGLNPSFVDGVGNIPNLGVPGKWTKTKYAVVEADDYAAVPGANPVPKFLYLNPQTIVVTNIEYDHPDVYRDLEQTKSAFLSFFKKLPPSGYLIANQDCPNLQAVLKQLRKNNPPKIITYGFSPGADWRVSKTFIRNQTNYVTLEIPGKIELELKIRVPGKFNAANACAALIAATQLGVSQAAGVKALEKFTGTVRRFQFVGSFAGAEVWDDYAHHPTELSGTLKAAKDWFPGKEIVAVFQPHTYSRTKALLSDFAKSLSLADLAVITDIYASARESGNFGISGESLLLETRKYTKNCKFVKNNDLFRYLRDIAGPGRVILTVGAGDIYRIGYQLVTANA